LKLYKVFEGKHTGRRSRLLVQGRAFRVADLRIAGSGHNSLGHRGRVGHWRRRRRRGIHPGAEAGGLTW
jgi:hypothetical protein